MKLNKLIKTLCVSLPFALLLSCSAEQEIDTASFQRFLDREAIEQVISKANLGYELFDSDLFASAFADDGIYELDSDVAVFGYQQLVYEGRSEVRRVVQDRVDSSANADPATMSYDPDSLRRFNRNSNSYITILDATHARHISNWMVVMKTNVDIHTSAIGRYEDDLIKRDGQWYIAKRVRVE